MTIDYERIAKMVARKYSSVHDYDDSISECYLTYWKYKDKIDSPQYLMVTMDNCIKALLRKKRIKTLPETCGLYVPDNTSVESTVMVEDCKNYIINSVKPKYRSVVFRLLENKSPAEISKELNLNISIINLRISRIRPVLRRLYERYNGKSYN